MHRGNLFFRYKHHDVRMWLHKWSAIVDFVDGNFFSLDITCVCSSHVHCDQLFLLNDRRNQVAAQAVETQCDAQGVGRSLHRGKSHTISRCSDLAARRNQVAHSLSDRCAMRCARRSVHA